MKLRNRRNRAAGSDVIFACAVVSIFLAAAGFRSPLRVAADTPRVHLEPHFAPGEVLHYQIDMRNVTKGRATGPVKDPEAASQLSQSTTVVVKLEVLPPAAMGATGAADSDSATAAGANGSGGGGGGTGASAAAGQTRIRATYEHSTSTNESDAYDDQAEALAEQFRKLEGQSIEFSIGADGRISDLTGLDAVLQDVSALASVRGWMSNLAPGVGLPKKGIAVGDKWHNDEPLPGAPLRGTVWHSDAEYVRNDACHAQSPSSPATSGQAEPSGQAQPSGATPAPAPVRIPAQTLETDPSANADSDSPNGGRAPGGVAGSEPCAVIITQFKILQSAPHGDLTPPEYLHNGLRTSGSWTGSGESMSMISLRTGLVVSVTQTSNQDMNFTISSPSSPAKLAYTGQVKSQSEITLLPEALAASR